MGSQTRKLKWSLDDLDLTKPIEPLSRLIDEPEKLIDEAFKIAAQYLPKDIVPSSLKDIPTVELKKLCLEQLKKVERKTLLNILTDGSNELTGDIDQSEINLNETCEPGASGSGLSKVTKDAEIQVAIASTSELAQEKDKTDPFKKKMKKTKHEASSSGEVKMTLEEKGEPSKKEAAENSNLDSILDQAEIEIRELELRAQAIRELLKKHESADNANLGSHVNNESLKESRKRQKIDSSHEESTNVSKEKTLKEKPQDVASNVQFHKKTDQKLKDIEMKTPTKATSRLSRNPVSMVEEDEPEDLPSSPTNNESNHKAKSAGADAKSANDKERRGNQRKRSADESNMMIQLSNDSDDSIDRELKGE